MAAEQEQTTVPRVSTSRLETFSDGVIAIAATLLILDVARPAADETIGRWLSTEWPGFAAYAISFVTIGILWVNHHALFHLVERVDRPLQFLNLGMLLTMAFLPLPTALAGDRIGGPDATAAVVLFTITLGVAASWLTLMWLYVVRHGDLLIPGGRGRGRTALRRSVLGARSGGLRRRDSARAAVAGRRTAGGRRTGGVLRMGAPPASRRLEYLEFAGRLT